MFKPFSLQPDETDDVAPNSGTGIGDVSGFWPQGIYGQHLHTLIVLQRGKVFQTGGSSIWGKEEKEAQGKWREEK